MITLGKFTMGEILPHIGQGKPKLKLHSNSGTVLVKASSSRLECLARNQACVRCQKKGNVWLLQASKQGPPRVPTNCFIDNCPWCALKHPAMKVGVETPHLNLYHANRKGGGLLLMTQDHIMPRHAGGSNDVENLQTMCTQCNNFKGGMLPHEYAKLMTKNERAIYSRRVDGGSSSPGGLPQVHAPLFNQADPTDCAAE